MPDNKKNMTPEQELWIKLLETSLNHLDLNWQYVFNIRKWAIALFVGMLAYLGVIYSKNNNISPKLYFIPIIAFILFALIDALALSWTNNTLKGIEDKQQKIIELFSIGKKKGKTNNKEGEASRKEEERLKIITLRSWWDKENLNDFIKALISPNLLIFYGSLIIITIIMFFDKLKEWFYNLC